jgi:hypothetical protein
MKIIGNSFIHKFITYPNSLIPLRLLMKMKSRIILLNLDFILFFLDFKLMKTKGMQSEQRFLQINLLLYEL